MMFKDKYDLTLNEVSLMFETGNIRILCLNRWVPIFWIARYYNRFMLDFSEMFNRDEISGLLSDDIMRLKIINRFTNFLPSLYYGLLISKDVRFLELYQELYGKEYLSMSDLKPILDEMERLKAKYKELGTPQQVIDSKGKMSFEKIIVYVEMVLERGLDRNMKLYQFKEQYDAAVVRAKEYEKMKLKK